MEQMIRWFDAAHGMRSVVAALLQRGRRARERRIGEDHDPETHSSRSCCRWRSGKRDAIAVFGDDYPTPDGTCIRDYIHVSDLADAHVLARWTGCARGGGSAVYNLGSGNGYSVARGDRAGARA